MIYTEPLKSYLKSAAFLSQLDLPEGTGLDFSLLGQGEYNLNYVFTHPVTGRMLVLRINTGSQMHLEDQIGYEFSALKILASSEKAGVYAISNHGGSQVFITGHSEYDADTLKKEYLRDKNAGLPIKVPENYFPDDDDTKEPLVTWRSHANLLYSNWLNYFVYQTTPYDLSTMKSK